MKKKILSTATILTISLLFVLCFSQQSWALIELMDGKLKINGFVKEMVQIRTTMTDREKRWHDSNIDYASTNALIEAQYTLTEGETLDDLTVRVFGGLKYWWQKAHYFDGDYRRSIPTDARRDWAHPRSFDNDMLLECPG